MRRQWGLYSRKDCIVLTTDNASDDASDSDDEQSDTSGTPLASDEQEPSPALEDAIETIRQIYESKGKATKRAQKAQIKAKKSMAKICKESK